MGQGPGRDPGHGRMQVKARQVLAARLPASKGQEEVLDGELNAGRRQIDAARRDDARDDGRVILATVMNDLSDFWVDDQIVLDTWKPEIAGKLGGRIDIARRR